jgi:hypothetical protein
MVRLDEVRAQVETDYAGLGMPTWPDPHPDAAAAREEEYSRLTRPGRYAVVHARARAWTVALTRLLGAVAEPLTPAQLGDGAHPHRFDRGVRLSPPRPGTLPLLLLERDAPLPVLHIGVVRAPAELQMLPDCGCDACDRGSDDLLEAVDLTIGTVVAGPSVVLRGQGWHAYWHPDGGSSHSAVHHLDHRDLMDLCRRLSAGDSPPLPAGTEAFVGRAWLG